MNVGHNPKLQHAPPCAVHLGEPFQDETTVVQSLIAELDRNASATLARAQAKAAARRWIEAVRNTKPGWFAVERLLQEYPVTSEEGLALMRLAEALLRVPDAATALMLIADKLDDGDWSARVGAGGGMLGNASGVGLWFAQKLVGAPQALDARNLIGKLGEKTVTAAVARGMRLMGDQFVLGETIQNAIKKGESLARENPPGLTRYSYDMLGEGARSMPDALRYDTSYRLAIDAIGQAYKTHSAARTDKPVEEAPGISIKLSALHPRYEELQRERVFSELLPRVQTLVRQARGYNLGVTIDAEESERLEISIDLFEALARDPAIKGWGGLGLAVQAYGTRTRAVIDRIVSIAHATGERLMLRLVKGAYWDSEIKHAQELGLPAYPVFTRKPSTDISYLACAQRLLAARDVLYPQFATHNALTTATILEFAKSTPLGLKGFEFQRLHGMGAELYSAMQKTQAVPCRVYAPVGQHRDLLAYLVRRLLENGANSSFVHQLADPDTPVDALLVDPLDQLRGYSTIPNNRIPLPPALFGQQNEQQNEQQKTVRKNSQGFDMQQPKDFIALQSALNSAPNQWKAQSLLASADAQGTIDNVLNPSTLEVIGTVQWATEASINSALTAAEKAFPAWAGLHVEERARCLEKAADLLEAHTGEWLSLCAREAGKTLGDGIAEVREAVDFCRYYARLARNLQGTAQMLPGYTGESNALSLHGRGVFVCVSPWNFPLAIFIGQVAAALVTGNCVVAKPAEQTPLIAYRATQLLHQAGVPRDVLQLLLLSGEQVRGSNDKPSLGTALMSHRAVAGVAFTGSTTTARIIQKTLADKPGPIVTFIAETGGMNAMIVDSTALPEQVSDAVIMSAFRSAGQRCSALRVLFLQDDIADNVLHLIEGAAKELTLGDPLQTTTDVGPVIDDRAMSSLNTHAIRMEKEPGVKKLFSLPAVATNLKGHFFSPRTYEISNINVLTSEVFGPVLHVVRFAANDLAKVIEQINGCGYGLTLGIQTRIDARVEEIRSKVNVGNIYVNRNMIGAVVGVQPFGGEGLSGTGPKAGGPYTLLRYCTERTFTVNTAAAGGNVALVAGEA